MYNEYVSVLKKEVVPALGCTEPVAIAFAVAKGTEILGKVPNKIEIYLSTNMIKNAMGVGIPGTGMNGIHIAAALGAIGGDADKGLEVLNGISKQNIEDAKTMVSDGKIKVCLKENIEDKLYIEVICIDKEKNSTVIVKGTHTNIVLTKLNDEVIFEKAHAGDKEDEKEEHVEFTIDKIYEFAMNAPLNELEFLLKGAEMNKKVAQEGLQNKYGLQVGKTLLNNEKLQNISNDLTSYVSAITAAAVDARMSGCSFPVMSTAGSGNQGLSATLPSVATAEKLEKSQEELARALALSNLVTIYAKTYIGRLSPLCGGGSAAATGSSAAITYLLGGNLTQIKYAIKNMIGNVVGMICDGAKAGCALKVATGATSAVQCAMLAINDIQISSNDGIIDDDVDKTIKNFGKIGTEGMINTDKVILNIMTQK